MKKIMLIVKYKAKHGLREKFVNDVFDLHIIDKIKCEDGFISYKYFYDAKEADDLLLVEEWESEEKQQNHLKTEHMKELKELKYKYLLDTKVTKFIHKRYMDKRYMDKRFNR